MSIELIKIRKLPYEEMSGDLPSTVYKYRSWLDHFHKEIITEQIVFMAPPASFEDTLDCKLKIRYDLLKDSEIIAKYLQLSKGDNPTWNRGQHRKYARDRLKTSLFKSKKYIESIQEDYFSDFNSRFGVLSLTANPRLFEMWEKYSNQHQGFCIGFDTNIMFKYFGGGGEVMYHDNLPIIHPFDSEEEKHAKQVFSKENKWAFEEEYRTHKFYPNQASTEDRRIKLPKDCYREIVFGAMLPKEHIDEIIRVCNEQELPVGFYMSKINENNEVSIHQI